LLDPLHMGTRFPSLLKDHEDRQQRLSAELCSSVSGFPPPVARHLAAPDPVIRTGYSSQATSSTQSTGTDLLLQQLMAEMKYLREMVDTLPTGPMQGVAASLQTSNEIPEPSSQSPSPEEEMEVDEKTALPYIPQPRLLSLFSLWRLALLRQTFRFLRWRSFVHSSGNMLHLRFAPYRRRAPP
jgi:hypothetical protein